MSLTNTHVVFICFAFLCILMGMQYTIYGGEENEFRNDFNQVSADGPPRTSPEKQTYLEKTDVSGKKRQTLSTLAGKV